MPISRRCDGGGCRFAVGRGCTAEIGASSIGPSTSVRSATAVTCCIRFNSARRAAYPAVSLNFDQAATAEIWKGMSRSMSRVRRLPRCRAPTRCARHSGSGHRLTSRAYREAPDAADVVLRPASSITRRVGQHDVAVDAHAHPAGMVDRQRNTGAVAHLRPRPGLHRLGWRQPATVCRRLVTNRRGLRRLPNYRPGVHDVKQSATPGLPIRLSRNVRDKVSRRRAGRPAGR